MSKSKEPMFVLKLSREQMTTLLFGLNGYLNAEPSDGTELFNISQLIKLITPPEGITLVSPELHEAIHNPDPNIVFVGHPDQLSPQGDGNSQWQSHDPSSRFFRPK